MQQDSTLKGKVAVVTGSNRGIGRAIAIEMARARATVVVSARDVSTLESTTSEIGALGGEYLAVACDVADEASVEAMGSAVLDRFGQADVVVANAGVGGPTKSMHEITLEEWRECLTTDLDGVYLTFKRFIPGMIERRTGSLIAISSMTGKRPLGGRTPYAAAKMGVIGLCRTLAVEVGPHGVRVNSVCPGAVEGPRLVDVVLKQAAAQGISVEEGQRQFTDPAPLKRFVAAEEVARACVFLASDASSAITGEDLNVNAGVAMY